MISTVRDVTVSPPAGDTARGRRRIAMSVAVVVLLAGGLATVLMVRHSEHRYGPIESGFFGGIYSERNLLLARDNSTGQLARTPGATALLLSSVENRGSHSVKITAIDTDEIVSRIRWGVYRTGPGGDVTGTRTPWRAFPAVVPAHVVIRLLITVHRPSYCERPTKTLQPGSFYSGYHRVHWDSLLHSHTTTIDDGLGDRNIRIC
jgi:hypothetical protein